ncbi:MAG: tetratricopeptide repeat protein, partial [bacterium]|nr:tetratricopeptide repeat protein [bacterium]
RLGQKGVDLVKAMSNLASILMTRGEYPRAEELYQQVLAIREQAYGGDDPSVATSLRSLGTLLYLRGDAESAESLLRRALEIRRRHFGDRDTRVAAARSSLARALHARGKYQEAGQLLTAVLTTRRELLGDDHPHVALTEKDLAALLLEREKPVSAERLAEAEVLLTQALGILRAWKPERSWEVAHAESLRGVHLMEQGRYEDAEPYLIDGYLGLRELRGAEAIYTRNAHRRLVELYAAWGRPFPDELKAAASASIRD